MHKVGLFCGMGALVAGCPSWRNHRHIRLAAGSNPCTKVQHINHSVTAEHCFHRL